MLDGTFEPGRIEQANAIVPVTLNKQKPVPGSVKSAVKLRSLSKSYIPGPGRDKLFKLY